MMREEIARIGVAGQLTDAEDRRRAKFVLFYVFAVALSLRIGFLIGHGPGLGGDTEDYLRLTNNLTTTGIYGFDSPLSFTVSMKASIPTIRRPPTYPFFLALIGGWSEPNPLIVIIVQVFLDSAIAVFIFVLARVLVDLRLALVTALLYALNPGAVVISNRLMSESLFTFLLFSSIALISIGLAKERMIITGIGGLVLGCAILCRAIALPLPFLLAASFFFIPRLTTRMRQGALLVFCAALIVVPWSIRCSRVAGSIVLVQGLSAIQFYIPSRSDVSQQRHAELYGEVFGPSTTDPYGRRLREATTPADVVEADRVGFKQTIENIKANPKRYIRSRMKSFPYLFLTSFDTFTGINRSFGVLLKNRDLFRLSIKVLLMMSFSVIPFLFALLGLSEIRRHPIIMLCAIVWTYNWFVHIPMWIEYRFWHPVVPCLLICSAVGMKRLITRVSRR